MLEIKDAAIPIKTFVDDNKYHIWGFHFFNRDERTVEIKEDFEMLSDPNKFMKRAVEYTTRMKEI